MAGMLYLVPTPIGNLGDISVRCREILAQADFIAAEDTRVTLKLLNHLELKSPMVSYYEHNKASSGGKSWIEFRPGRSAPWCRTPVPLPFLTQVRTWSGNALKLTSPSPPSPVPAP